MRPRFVELADKEQRWGDSLNGSWTGLLGMLQRGEVDIVFGGFYCLPDRANAFHPTMPYTHESISWWVPRPHLVPNWQILFGALPSDAGWGGLMVLTLSAATVLGMQRAQRAALPRGPGLRPRRGDGVVQVMLSIVGTALDQPPLVLSHAAAPRLFYFTYVFFFFHFNIVFRTAITTRLASRPHLPGLSTYHDLLLHGFEVGTSSTDQAVDLMLDDEDMASIRDLHKDCEVSECLRKLQQRHDNYGLLFSSAVMQYLTPKYFLDSAGMPYVERLPSPALPTYVTMYLRKGHPLAMQVDALFARLVEAGLPDVWLRKAASADHRDKDGDGVPDPEDGGADKELTLEHLTGALVALGLGSSLAVLAYLAELATSLGSLVARRLRVSVSWRPATADDSPVTRRSPSSRRLRRADPGARHCGVLSPEAVGGLRRLPVHAVAMGSRRRPLPGFGS
ncbi:uncharacterized protein LOC113201815 isoform X2 [Frankliniella occidentalis]|uniref:Uncharacterized protein LOC113201815 isoform X2 n=1 Tax=Frankliniella occidentalis TaxID=133901 RepID=A0A9C6XVK7_FRAOC|nr:uncharacterized protein LOC113201815 isoform X2 [Frankliniella occidentalis]